MLFNSYVFIFAFLPVALGGYFLWGWWGKPRCANRWLVIASLIFYGCWDMKYLPLLMGSILVNYFVSGRVLKAREREDAAGRKGWFLLGLMFNLLLLGYYKYLDFFLENINRLGADFPLLHLVLPLGISFFTITQLLYLFDCSEGVTKDHSFWDYALFVSFFPHLLAGPILYHKSMMPQFRKDSLKRIQWENMSRGLSLFLLGLMKKVLVADNLSAFVAAGYGDPAGLTLFSAWLTAVSYMLQLYYDFSGYSDMAVGLALMLNLRIPINFNSPYRARDLISFWQRWHISLTNAITACIYMPMIRAFRSPGFRHTVFVVFVTFFIVGIWHGAGWTYVVFALIHSLGLVVNNLWKHYHLWLPRGMSRPLMLLTVLISMVFFRAPNVEAACQVLGAMAGGQGVAWPQKVADLAGSLGGISLTVGNVPGQLPKLVFLAALLLVIFSPNSNELVKRYVPSRMAAAILALGGFAVLLFLTQPSEFLYFQF